jgi:hypothetical protein
MDIIPRGKPVLTDLNSYYLKVKNLLEHYQGELGSGGLFFTSAGGKGVLFFDQDVILSGYYQNGAEALSGQPAIDYLLNPPDNENFTINVYAIDPENVYYWTSIPGARILYDNLSSEFTDIKALINKMIMKKLTGYIDIQVNGRKDRGLLFFQNGKAVGESFNWQTHPKKDDPKARDLLVARIQQHGGLFKVYEIALKQSSKVERDHKDSTDSDPDPLPMLGMLLYILERVVSANKKIRQPFSMLLKRKFIQKADQFPFLDPFAGEFEYHDRKVHYSGQASREQLVAAMTETVREMAEEMNIRDALLKTLEPWFVKFENEIQRFGIQI